jgi:hypothetical protein
MEQKEQYDKKIADNVEDINPVPFLLFGRMSGTVCDIKTFVEKDFFSEYDFYEMYDEKHEYAKDLYTKDYGYGERQYHNAIFNIGFYENPSKKIIERRNYVIAEEQISKHDKDFYARYCQCSYCLMSSWNPKKYYTCAHCCGCLKSDADNQYVIKKTREYLQKRNLL